MEQENETPCYCSQDSIQTQHTKAKRAWQVMEMLDRLYRLFDELTQKYSLFKVETIGDAYMTVANLRCPQQDHAALVARFAIEAVQAANSVMVRSDDSSSGFLSIRAGVILLLRPLRAGFAFTHAFGLP